MKVLLAAPTVAESENLGRSRSLGLVSNYIPSLGLGYLAACLRADGVEARIWNPVVPEPVGRLAGVVSEWQPDVLGLSVFTPHVRSLPRLFELLKSNRPAPFTVVGGPHVSALPVETMRRYPADIGVIGEGEETLPEIVRRLREGGPAPRGTPGTVFRSGEEIALAPPRPPIEPLDSLPYCARDLMPPLRAHRPTPASVRRLPLAVLITSRGCPYRCTFCDRAVFGNNYRTHSPEYVVGEMKDVVHRHGAREVRFFDDDIAVDRARALRLAELIAGSGPRVPWTCNLSAAAADPELFRAFRRAGCWQVLFGLESGSERVLRALKKPTTLGKSARAVRLALEAGLRVRADFIVGTPGETIAEMWETVRFAIRLDPDMAHFNKFVPFPGTEIHADLARAGRVFDYERNWSDSDNANLVYAPDGVDPDTYRDFLDRSYRAFYLRPRYVLRRLSRIRTWTEFAGHVRGLFAMLFL